MSFLRLGATITLIAYASVAYIKNVHAEDSSNNSLPDWTELSKQPKDSFKEKSKLSDEEFYAQFNEQVKQYRKIQSARFKEHPKQLKDPKRCDKLLVTGKNGDWIPATADSYAMIVACEDVTGITAQKERARENAYAVGKGNNPYAKAVQRMIEKREELHKDYERTENSRREQSEQHQRKADLRYQEDMSRILNDSIRNHEEDREIQNLRNESQAEDQQRRIDKLEQDEEDDRAMDKAIAHDYMVNGDYDQARQWEGQARMDGGQ